MSNTVLIIGQSGTGKSTSICNLDPKSTFIINVLDKSLPFRGFRKNYVPISSWEDKTGNYLATDQWDKIIRCIQMVDKVRPDIKTLVLDDWQYILAQEFMRRVSERGFDKYSELGMHGWSTINALTTTRTSLTGIILAHSEVDNTGKSKVKTIGKMLDEKITIEGMFTTVLHSRIIDGRYCFQTQHDGDHVAKSPIGMFEEGFIDNDLLYVKNKIESYYNEGV